MHRIKTAPRRGNETEGISLRVPIALLTAFRAAIGGDLSDAIRQLMQQYVDKFGTDESEGK